MRNLFKSAIGFSWSLALLGAKSVARLVSPSRSDRAAGAELDTVSRAAADRLDGPFDEIYETADRLQNRVVDGVSGGVSRQPRSDGGGGTPKPFDAAIFVVLGDGLAAGMNHFSLDATSQATSFPALVARSLGTDFAQPLFEPPGLGDVIGLEPQPPIVPNIPQSSVLQALPSEATLGNLSVPGLSLAEARRRRPEVPIVDRRSNLQTLINFILGLPDLMRQPQPGMSQLDYACHRRPTLALVALGYDQALRAAVAGDPGRLPSRGVFRDDYSRLLRDLGDRPVVIATTIPDPIASAYFSDLVTAAEILKTTPEFLQRHWGLASDDLVHLRGLYAIGYQMMGRKVAPLAEPPAIAAATARAISQGVAELNRAIRDAAESAGARVFDLHGAVASLARDGVEIAGRRLHGTYLGGLYLLNGGYPGATLNALIAGAMVRWINDTFDRAFDEPAVDPIAADDPNTLTELAPGPPATDAFLHPRRPDEIPGIAPLPPDMPPPTPIQTTYPSLFPDKAGCTPLVGVPAAGFQDPSYQFPGPDGGPPAENPSFVPLEIPAEGIEYTLDVNPELSYFGDALRPVDCPGEQPFLPGFPPFGTCGTVFFGGYLLTTSQLSGKIHLKFSPPDAQGVTHFEVSHPGTLRGGEGDLTGPQLFRMPVQHTIVSDMPGFVSSGDLHLRTGEVTNFHYNLQNMNTALHSLLMLNPGPAIPQLALAALNYPGQPNSGSTWASFSQRPDGKLGVSIAGHMFVPFGDQASGKPVRFALPFTTPDLRAASFVARGTSIHPRVFVTSEATPPAEPDAAPEIPFNSVRDFTSISHNTCFGDAFGLHAKELGEGGAIGRSQLLSRIRVQFGADTGGTVPVTLQVLPPGGLLNDAPAPPPFLPPYVPRGEIGFDTVMHFPKQTYPQSGLASPDDPLNISATSFRLDSGRAVSPLLWRGYVVQALFADLVQVEPCTPSDSFNYQGDARFERGPHGEIVLRWNGTVYLPYPKGFKFPSPGPGGRPPFVIGADSRLDPFRIVLATHHERPPRYRGVLRGDFQNQKSPSTGAVFSYRFSLPTDPARAREAEFVYTDHAKGGTFELSSLIWIEFATAGVAPAAGGLPDTVTFTGFGTWSLDRTGAFHQVAVQISLAPQAPFVGIVVDDGTTSNVDIKPASIPYA